MIIYMQLTYRKIPKISPRAYIFLSKAFLRGLSFEGLVFRGAYIQREICVSKSPRLNVMGGKYASLNPSQD